MRAAQEAGDKYTTDFVRMRLYVTSPGQATVVFDAAQLRREARVPG